MAKNGLCHAKNARASFLTVFKNFLSQNLIFLLVGGIYYS